MEEDELNQLSNEKFFELFLDATKSMYEDYCHFMAVQEELKNCFVPDYEMALNNFEKKLSNIDNNDFFKVFLTQTKKMHIDYCEFKRAEEGLTSFGEPTFEAAMNQFEDRINSSNSQVKS